MINLAPQKALHYSEAIKKKSYIPQTFAIQPKLDGWYCMLDYIDGNWGKLSSRAEREIPSLDFLHEHIYKCLSPAENTRFIFEATIPDMQFHELNGVLNRKSESAENVVLNLHDIIFLDRPELPFKDRYEYVNPAYLMLKEYLGHWVKLVPILAISSQEDVFYYHFNQVTSSGGEGIILKNYDTGYFFGKRNAHLMKLKELITKDFAVVDLLPGEKGSKYEFTLGALVVQGRNGIKHTVSGMSDDERNLWWSNPDLIKGKVVQVNAMKELPDGSLREGRYKWVRHDKELWEID